MTVIAEKTSRVDQLAGASTAQQPDQQELVLNAHQTLSISQDAGGTLLKVQASGETLVCLRITAEGAEVLLSDGCAIRSSGNMSLEADDLTLKARKQLSLESDGDARLNAKGDFSSTARIQNLRSTLGNVNIKANDDVKVRAERICLNT